MRKKNGVFLRASLLGVASLLLILGGYFCKVAKTGVGVVWDASKVCSIVEANTETIKETIPQVKSNTTSIIEIRAELKTINSKFDASAETQNQILTIQQQILLEVQKRGTNYGMGTRTLD